MRAGCCTSRDCTYLLGAMAEKLEKYECDFSEISRSGTTAIDFAWEAYRVSGLSDIGGNKKKQGSGLIASVLELRILFTPNSIVVKHMPDWLIGDTRAVARTLVKRNLVNDSEFQTHVRTCKSKGIIDANDVFETKRTSNTVIKAAPNSPIWDNPSKESRLIS